MKIIHCLRTPVGGLFRHVQDLVRLQSEAGHEVGVICDSTTGGERADEMLRKLESVCALGVRRSPMSRGPSYKDFTAFVSVRNMIGQLKPDIVHGHGAKGGAYARLAGHMLKSGKKSLAVFYTPHGGSLHYSAGSAKGKFFLGMERFLASRTDGIIFESAYSAQVYKEKIGDTRCETRVIHNGVMPNEFYDRAIDSNATDFFFIGELRHLKGVDVLLHAMARLTDKYNCRANIIGAGSDEQLFKKLAQRMGLNNRVHFLGAMPARQGFALGQCLIVPSRNESLPYIILEASAANVPLILTDVGGIGEITESTSMGLIQAGNVDELYNQMVSFLEEPAPFFERAGEMQERIKKAFTSELMSSRVLEFYEDILGTSD